MSLITVEDDAGLYIYDFAGKGGYIHYEGKLTSDDDEIFRHIIFVKEGGKLVVNGGTIEAGRSKQIYGKWYSEDDEYTGNIRHQIVGHAVKLNGSGTAILNGGEFYGRGSSNAAIYADDNSTLIINDAYIQGEGGARGISCLRTKNVFIRSVEIDTTKVDRYANFTDTNTERYRYGEYGMAVNGNLSDFVVGNVKIKQSDPNEKDVFGYRVHQYATITPSETPANVGLQLQDPGWSTFSTDSTNLVTADERRVSIKDDFTPHYSSYESELFRDYNNNTDYTILSKWQIFDKNGKTAVNNHQSSQASSYAGLAKSIDMCQFKAVNGTDALKLTNGELYVLRLTIHEVWRGYTKQMSITRTAEMNFGAAPDLSGLDFGISAQQDRSGTTFSVNITPSETNGVLPNSSAGDVIMEECMYSSTFDTVSFGNLPTGKQTIVARLQGNDAFGFKQAFTFVGKDYGSTHKITATVNRTEMENTKANAATVSIMPNFDGAIDTFDAFAIDKSISNHSTLGDASAVAADVNADGDITIADISLIMSASVSSEDVISQAR